MGLLDFLSGALPFAGEAVSGYQEGKRMGMEDRLAQQAEQARQRQAEEDRKGRLQMQQLNMRNIESQIAQRNQPKPPSLIYDQTDNFFVDPATPTRVIRPEGAGADTTRSSPAYEERSEDGGIAIYENGRFKSWKVRPRVERETPQYDPRAFQREGQLSGDFRQEQAIKDANGIASAVATIRGALANPTPQGDLAAIYALVKLYDPGSVVREGEIALTQSAASLPQRVRVLYDQYRSGQKLLPEQRAAIAEIANSIVAERQIQINPVLQRYGRRARQWGVDSAVVAPNPLEGAEVRPQGFDLSAYGLTPAPRPNTPAVPPARPR